MTRLVDVRSRSEADLSLVVGSFARTLIHLAHGEDDRPVEPHRERKSVGSETTYPQDLIDRERIADEVRALSKECTDWLSRRQMFAKTVTLKVRYGDFQTITRSETSTVASRDEVQLAQRAIALVDKTEAGRRPIRLLGVSLHGLSDSDSSDTATAETSVAEKSSPGPIQLPLPFVSLAQSPSSNPRASH
ncbi:MAG TPA: hypothetical protein PLY80_06970, partial [Pseudomonadota bacterium]|nr:hypothetical protein [Pseudomonadota bacterium]